MQNIEHPVSWAGLPEEDPTSLAAQYLRHGGVYRLPDGSEYVAGVGDGGHYFLYPPVIWKARRWIISMPVAYEVDPAKGVVTGKGRQTHWRLEDLEDTQRTIDR
jgi:hypothetical protein